MKKIDFKFDIEKEFKDKNIVKEKIHTWEEKLAKISSDLRKGVSHAEKKSLESISEGYKAMINFVEQAFL